VAQVEIAVAAVHSGKSSEDCQQISMDSQAIRAPFPAGFQQTSVCCMANRTQFRRDLSAICRRRAREVYWKRSHSRCM